MDETSSTGWDLGASCAMLIWIGMKARGRAARKRVRVIVMVLWTVGRVGVLRTAAIGEHTDSFALRGLIRCFQPTVHVVSFVLAPLLRSGLAVSNRHRCEYSNLRRHRSVCHEHCWSRTGPRP